MERIKIIVLVLSLIIFSYALHKKSHLSADTYLLSLKSAQNSASTQLTALKNNIIQVQSQTTLENNITPKIQSLEQAILTQRNMVSTLARSLQVPLNDSSWTCPTYTATSDSEIKALSSSINANTADIQSTINQISNQTSKDFFNQYSAPVNSIAQDLQKSVFSTGTINPVLNSTLETNWLANNWVTGTKTLANVDTTTKQTDAINFVTPCPVSTPFFDGTLCIACPTDQLFNWETKKCIQCKSFDAVAHKCNDPPPPPPPANPNITNFQIGLNRMILDPSINTAQLLSTAGSPCPTPTPFLTSSGICINCESPQTLFNYANKVCVACLQGQTYIQQKHACIIVTNSIKVTNLPAGSNSMILPSGVTLDTLQAKQIQLSKSATLDPCPAITPFYNGATCISCPIGQYFSVSTLTCISCKNGQTYNPITHTCSLILLYTNQLNRNWTSTNPDSIRNLIKLGNSTPGAIPCPLQKPFYDGTNCRGCPDNQQFNFDGKVCEACGPGTLFSSNLHSCVKWQINGFQTNLIGSTPNLIYDGTSINQYMQQYRSNLQKYPHMTDCPVESPYFDGVSCISCPKDYPLFNLQSLVCQACSQGSTYDATAHQCMSSTDNIISQEPNIEKILASIFA